jgi:cysteine-rich repeat protein
VGRVDVVFGGTTEISVSDDGVPCSGAIACQPPLCGNGMLDAGEECDDANLVGGDGCGSVCNEEISNDHCEDAMLFTDLPFVVSMDTTFADTTPRRPPLCGSNAQPQNHDIWFQFVPSESCDDVVISVDDGPNSIRSSLFSGTNCSNLAHLACNAQTIVRSVNAGTPYWIAIHDTWSSGAPGTFTLTVTCAACGNGVVEASEECDDGNAVNDDGCSNQCLLPSCGDGVIQAGEACDDGNTNWGDNCGGDCSVVAQCMQVSHCRLISANNACNLSECTGGACLFETCVEFGDIDGSGLVNLDDILRMLAGFAGDPYYNANGDISPCGANGIVSIDDILSVLAAFGGYDPCGCNSQAIAPLCGSNQP